MELKRSRIFFLLIFSLSLPAFLYRLSNKSNIYFFEAATRTLSSTYFQVGDFLSHDRNYLSILSHYVRFILNGSCLKKNMHPNVSLNSECYPPILILASFTSWSNRRSHFYQYRPRAVDTRISFNNLRRRFLSSFFQHSSLIS